MDSPMEEGGSLVGQLSINQSKLLFFLFFFLNKKIRGVKRGVAPSNWGVRGV
ncbi:hypothetical protein Hanom_Chr11g01010791 [Helianthus anomalus]